MALLSVALGQFDIFFNYQTNIWDIVPGLVIIKGAGGYTTSSLDNAFLELEVRLRRSPRFGFES